MHSAEVTLSLLGPVAEKAREASGEVATAAADSALAAEDSMEAGTVVAAAMEVSSAEETEEEVARALVAEETAATEEETEEEEAMVADSVSAAVSAAAAREQPLSAHPLQSIQSAILLHRDSTRCHRPMLCCSKTQSQRRQLR